jgi:hypothetical protein
VEVHVQPVWHFSFAGLLILLFAALFIWRLFNHREGRSVVLMSSALIIGFGLLRAFGAEEIPLGTSNVNPPIAQQTAEGDVFFTVTAGPYTTREECERSLATELHKSIDAYIDSFIGQPGAGRRVDLGMDYILNQLVVQRRFETTQASFGEMQNLHAEVRIDRDAQSLIRQRHQDALRQARLGYAGGAFGLLLVLLATAFGYLKLDTLTKGYYSGRLKLAATAVILTAAAATALVVRQVDPAANWPLKLPFTQSPQLDESPI